MNKIQYARLWDVYAPLFTTVQREICEMYFDYDLTTSEIAAEKGITRQAAYDCVNSCKKQLGELESKLGICKADYNRDLQSGLMLAEALKWTDRLEQARPELKEELKELKDILFKDRFGEAENMAGKTAYDGAPTGDLPNGGDR